MNEETKLNKRVWVYDLETLNIFTATFVDRDSDEKRVFVLTNEKNEIKELISFLKNEVSGLIGYNCIHFDAQILEYIFRNPNCDALNIRKYSQIITSENNRRPDIPEWRLKIKHLDLFRALSLSVKAKRVGLKWVEYMMDYHNIEDMPSDESGSENWEDMVLSYNLNDVLATKYLYQKYIYEIDLRRTTTTERKVDVMNSTEPDMAKKLFCRDLSLAMKISESDLKSMYTERDIVNVNDIILPYVEFKTDTFKNVLNQFKTLQLRKEDKFEFSVLYDNISIDFALGGLHASVQKTIVIPEEGYLLKSADVVSYYPNLAIRNQWSPAHLPKKIFCDLYEGYFNERRATPKSDPKNYILKILLNSAYGLTNDDYSFLRDRQLTLAICINGQLLLTMLFEEIIETIPGSKLIMVNTDGFECLIPKEYENKYISICKNWEKKTKLELEFAEYSKMVIRDVNNYQSFYTNGKYKLKGAFEFENIPLHKNKSHNIVPLAVFKYFKDSIPVETTIRNHTNIFDFCAGIKSTRAKFDENGNIDGRGGSHYEQHWIEGDKRLAKKLSKTVRYYISNKGKYLFKVYENGSLEHVEAPLKKGSAFREWKTTYFNKYEEKDMKDYDINYDYYIIKAKEMVFQIENKQQLSLF